LPLWIRSDLVGAKPAGETQFQKAESLLRQASPLRQMCHVRGIQHGSVMFRAKPAGEVVNFARTRAFRLASPLPDRNVPKEGSPLNRTKGTPSLFLLFVQKWRGGRGVRFFPASHPITKRVIYFKSAQAIRAPPGAWMTTAWASGRAVKKFIAKPLPCPAA
jgi:hypothetical protein